jgi:hypothetical protein
VRVVFDAATAAAIRFLVSFICASMRRQILDEIDG